MELTDGALMFTDHTLMFNYGDEEFHCENATIVRNEEPPRSDTDDIAYSSYDNSHLTCSTDKSSDLFYSNELGTVYESLIPEAGYNDNKSDNFFGNVITQM